MSSNVFKLLLKLWRDFAHLMNMGSVFQMQGRCVQITIPGKNKESWDARTDPLGL